MSNKNLIPVDRSRIVTDWDCARRRYLNYDYDGFGLTTVNAPLELEMGIIVHDSLAEIAKQQPNVDIDDIAYGASEKLFAFLMKGRKREDLDFEQKELHALEQRSLIEGMLRGFYKYQWPHLMKAYPKILAIEQEMSYNYGRLLYMAKPDLVAVDAEGEVTYIEYKTTSSKKEEWINSWTSAIQLHSTVRVIEENLGEKIEKVVVQGLYKGYECLSPSTPVLTADLRWVPVGTLNVGDKIAGFEEQPTKHKSGRNNKRQWKEAEVTFTGRKSLPSYKLVLEDGTDFICSENHLWLVSRNGAGSGSSKWVKTKDLTKGCYLLKVTDMWNEDTSHSAGYLAAAFDGEGNLCQTRTKTGYWLSHLAFTQKQNEMLNAVRGMMLSKGIKFGKNERRGAEKVGGTYIHGQAQIMKFLGSIRPKRLLPKFSFEKLGGMTVLGKPLAIKSLEFIGDHEVVALGTSTETLIAKGIATHNSYGKQSSPFCYAYKRTGTPPFSRDEITYEYKAGFKRSPVWEMDGGVKAWVASMPDTILVNQFPQTPPIFINDDMVENFFAQRNIREQEIQIATGMLDFAPDAETKEAILNTTFPQNFSACSPAWGKGCPYKRICFGQVAKPLEQGFIYRTPHHMIELEAQKKVSK